jgi:RNA polymerase sigma factor (sigma-70 family)
LPLVLQDRLIEDAKLGGAALEQLVTAVWPEAYRIALGILRDASLAEDAAQDACAAMARSLPALKTTAHFRSWAYRAIVNHAITTGRRHPRTRLLDATADHAIDADRSDAIDLYRALAKLSHIQRAVVLMHYYAGLDSGEIATATGLPRSTIRFHLMLARRALRAALSAQDFPASPSQEAISNAH